MAKRRKYSPKTIDTLFGACYFMTEIGEKFLQGKSGMETSYIVMNDGSNEKIIELIKLVIGTRTLRKVEEEAGISHGLLGKVLRGTQKPSVDLLQKLTAKGANPQNDVTYMMLLEAAKVITRVEVEGKVNDEDSTNGRMLSYADKLHPLDTGWMEKVKTSIKERYGVKDSDIVSVRSAVAAFEKSVCSDVIVTDKDGNKIWVSFLYDNGKAMSDRIINFCGRIAFTGADKYLIVVNTMKALTAVEKAKESLRKVDYEVGTLLIEG